MKHNEAADFLAVVSMYVAAHGRLLALGAVALLIVIGAVIGYGAWQARTDERAHEMLQAAIEIGIAPGCLVG